MGNCIPQIFRCGQPAAVWRAFPALHALATAFVTFLVLAGLCLTSPQAFAQLPTTGGLQAGFPDHQIMEPRDLDMTPAADDRSMKLLKSVLGDWNEGATNSVFVEAMTIFNSGVLIFASVLFGFGIVKASMDAAHTGEFMGKAINSMWMPLRFTGGVITLMPTVNGLSLIQLMVLWLASMGIGLANLVYHGAVEKFVESQGYQVTARMAEKGAVKDLMGQVLVAETCMAAMKKSYPDSTWRLDPPANVGGSGYRFEWGADQFIGFDGNTCGSLLVPRSRRKENGDNYMGQGVADFFGATQQGGAEMSAAQNRAIYLAATQVLRPIAQRLADPGNDASGTQAPPPAAHEVLAAVNEAANRYDDAVRQAAQSFLNAQNGKLTAELKHAATVDGWVGAGAWFFRINEISSEINRASSFTPSMQTAEGEPGVVAGILAASNIIDAGIQGPPREIIAYTEKMLVTAGKLDAEATMTQNNVAQAGRPREVGPTIGNSNGTLIGNMFGIDPQNPKNAIVQLKDTGDTIIVAAEAVGAVVLVAMAAKDVANDSLPGKFIKRFPVIGTLVDAVTKLAGTAAYIALLAVGGLLMMGAIMAFYIPIVPALLWIGSVLGWLVTVIEMTIAAPLWAAAHMHPSGDGVAGDYGQNGYMLLVEVFARPVLMIFGFLFAAVLADPFLKYSVGMLNLAFTTSQENSLGGTYGPMTNIAYLVIFVSFCMMMVNRIFSLVHVIPNSVMRWVGGRESGHDQAQQVSNEVHGGMQTGAAKAQAIVAGGYGMHHRAEDLKLQRAQANKHATQSGEQQATARKDEQTSGS